MRGALGGIAAAIVVAATTAAGASAAAWPTLPATDQVAAERAADLAAAEAGIAGAQRWWNADEGWYDDFLFPPPGGGTLARLWSVYPLLEALIAVYRADPTPANLARLKAVADTGGDLYWNPS